MSAAECSEHRIKYRKAKADMVEIPRKLVNTHRSVILAIDAMFVNGIHFFVLVSHNIKYHSASIITNHKVPTYHEAIKKVFALYNVAGFVIGTIRCNSEFRPVLEVVKGKLGITVQYAPPGAHVLEIERSNRVVKERIRASYHSSPYDNIPIAMIVGLVMDSNDKLNFFPPKGGVSQYYSPRDILKLPRGSYARDFAVAWGAYVQAQP